MKSRFASWFTSSPPTVGVEIGARRVTAVSLGEHGGKPMVAAHATEMLPEGLVTPALNQPNIADRAASGRGARPGAGADRRTARAGGAGRAGRRGQGVAGEVRQGAGPRPKISGS